MNEIIEKISADYDLSLNASDKLYFEAKLAVSDELKKVYSIHYFDFYLITKSIKKVHRKVANLY